MYEAMRMDAAKLLLACSWLAACDLPEARMTPSRGRGEAVSAAEAAVRPEPSAARTEPRGEPEEPEPQGQPPSEPPAAPEGALTLAGGSALSMFPLSAEPEPPQPPPGYGL